MVAVDISGCGGGITIPIPTEAGDDIGGEGGMRRQKPLAHIRRTPAVHLCTPDLLLVSQINTLSLYCNTRIFYTTPTSKPRDLSYSFRPLLFATFTPLTSTSCNPSSSSSLFSPPLLQQTIMPQAPVVISQLAQAVSHQL